MIKFPGESYVQNIFVPLINRDPAVLFFHELINLLKIKEAAILNIELLPLLCRYILIKSGPVTVPLPAKAVPLPTKTVLLPEILPLLTIRRFPYRA